MSLWINFLLFDCTPHWQPGIHNFRSLHLPKKKERRWRLLEMVTRRQIWPAPQTTWSAWPGSTRSFMWVPITCLFAHVFLFCLASPNDALTFSNFCSFIWEKQITAHSTDHNSLGYTWGGWFLVATCTCSLVLVATCTCSLVFGVVFGSYQTCVALVQLVALRRAVFWQSHRSYLTRGTCIEISIHKMLV